MIRLNNERLILGIVGVLSLVIIMSNDTFTTIFAAISAFIVLYYARVNRYSEQLGNLG